MPADEMAILGASASDGMVLTPNLAQSRNILSPASEQLNHCGLVSSDAIWQQRSGSTLAQVMACCLMAPSHYLSNLPTHIKDRDLDYFLCNYP